MAKHTDVGIIWSTGGSNEDWTNIGYAGNNSTSSYAESGSVTYGLGKYAYFYWPPAKIQSVVPVGATINGIKLRVVPRLSDTGTGTIKYVAYSYNTDENISSVCDYTQQPNVDFSNSFTTCDISLSNVSDNIITDGFFARIQLINNRFAIRSFHIATVKILVTYTVPDITYTYKNYDGTVLKTQTVEQGTSPTAPSDPARASTAEYTYTFSGWSLSGTTYTAQYTATKRSYTVSASVSPSGSGSVSGTGTYEYGTAVTLTASPVEGYSFSSWSDGEGKAQRSVTVTGNVSLTACFVEDVSSDGVYIGTKKVTVYCGTKKVSVYRGTTKIT